MRYKYIQKCVAQSDADRKKQPYLIIDRKGLMGFILFILWEKLKRLFLDMSKWVQTVMLH